MVENHYCNPQMQMAAEKRVGKILAGTQAEKVGASTWGASGGSRGLACGVLLVRFRQVSRAIRWHRSHPLEHGFVHQ